MTWRDVVHVDAAGDHVGRDEHADLAVLEAVERLLALALRAVAVDGLAADAGLVERAREALRPAPRAREHQRALGVVVAEVLDQQVDLLLVVDGQDALLDVVDRLGAAAELDEDRLVQRVVDDAEHGLAHRRGEEQVLALCRDGVDDALHVRPEAHVEHAVGLVQDERVDLVQQDVTLAEHVEQAAWRGDQQVDALADAPWPAARRGRRRRRRRRGGRCRSTASRRLPRSGRTARGSA